MNFKITTALTILLAICGCKATKPGGVETTVVNDIKHKITVGGKDWQNPIPYTPGAVKEGQEHFQHHCGICHGLDGQNTGVPFAQKMMPPVADLASEEVQKYADGQLKWIIQNGIEPSGMPGWKDILDDDEMWKMVHFIRHLPAKGSLGAPAIYKEAEEEHGKWSTRKAKLRDLNISTKTTDSVRDQVLWVLFRQKQPPVGFHILHESVTTRAFIGRF